MMRAKICGITSMEEARLAIEAGADALGFLVGLDYPSDDRLSAEEAREIVAGLPPFVSTVLVTHRTEPDWVEAACWKIRCSTVQLHGDYPLEEIPELRQRLPHLKILKAVHVEDEGAVARAREVERWVDAVLLDTKTATRIGGTGQTHDWGISARVVAALHRPVILSGGLNPENVVRAIEIVRPYAVDVNSGVENPDGSKSPEKVRAFIALAKGLPSPRPAAEPEVRLRA